MRIRTWSLASMKVRRILAVDGLPARSYPWATAAGGLLVLSGIVAVDVNGSLVGQDDPAEQARQILHNVGLILAADRAEPSGVLHIRCYATTPAAFSAYVEEKSKHFPQQPSATSVLVAGLMLPGSLLEIDVIAARTHRFNSLRLRR